MGMRLMPKSEVLEKQAAQKRQDIEAGLKLAKRVDATRETLAQEERKLEEFRSKRVKEIHDEIEPLEKTRDALKIEIGELENRRFELLKPLDKEWEEVREAKRLAQNDQIDAQSLLAKNQETERQLTKATKQAGDAITRALTKEERAKGLLATAAAIVKEEKQRLRNASKLETKAIRLEEEGRKEFLARDNAYALKENGLILREANLKESEAALAKEWKLLEDRKRMFERNITRAKK